MKTLLFSLLALVALSSFAPANAQEAQDDCIVPAPVAYFELEAYPWECTERFGWENEIGWKLRGYDGTRANPKAIVGNAGRQILWTRGMKKPYVYRESHPPEVRAIADALRQCLFSQPLDQCHILRDTLLTQLSKIK